MKKIILTSFLLITIVMKAQVATIDSRKILEAVPEIAKIDTLVAQEQQRYVADLNSKIKEVQIQEAALQDLKAKKTPEADLKKAEENLNKMVVALQQQDADLGKKLNDYKNLLYKPYIEKINSAIKTVADRNKYMQVIDIQTVALAYLNPTADITEEVIKEISKK